MPQGHKPYSKEDIQILVSTMNRNSLDFLEAMFPNVNSGEFKILVVNQGGEAVTSLPNVKVVNTDTKGLSLSRNIAIENATAKLCVLADDDVVFEKGFEEHIINAFTTFNNASAITFQYSRPGVTNPVKSYRLQPFRHNNTTIRGVSSVEIVINRDSINANKCRFNVNFGLGAFFEVAEEFLFLRSVLVKGLNIYYYPAPIVMHDEWSSGRDHGNDRLVYGRAALACKLYGTTAGLWLLKYLQFLVRKKIIPVTAVAQKFKIGMQGINKYKSLLNEGKESRDNS